MYWFLAPLLLGFACNLASAFTTSFSRRWGERRGSLLTAVLRNVLGIPIWAIGFFLAARASSPELWASGTLTTVAGWLLIGAGAGLIVTALVTIRWRAVTPSVRDVLAEGGLYAHVRHPMHAGTLLEFAGLLLVKPSATIGLACALGALWILLQTKFEEWDLVRRQPAYRDYMDRVPRFLPRFRVK